VNRWLVRAGNLERFVYAITANEAAVIALRGATDERLGVEVHVVQVVGTPTVLEVDTVLKEIVYRDRIQKNLRDALRPKNLDGGGYVC
jgi:hypothetical protein